MILAQARTLTRNAVDYRGLPTLGINTYERGFGIRKNEAGRIQHFRV